MRMCYLVHSSERCPKPCCGTYRELHFRSEKSGVGQRPVWPRFVTVPVLESVLPAFYGTCNEGHEQSLVALRDYFT